MWWQLACVKAVEYISKRVDTKKQPESTNETKFGYHKIVVKTMITKPKTKTNIVYGNVVK